ncbi:tetratricopeptide repeat protein [Vibrio splendidus]|uniref:tetratricopeptide repeat protein n=1 Tax=Vibrio splendidus TaxID=29497 RepID=UPI00031D7F91|nr:tetratricopeptide repeat protein [Vibrio splendidus]OEF69249.1 hypothetical protein A148_23450 [Vibrio splendidus 1F-157]
MYRFLILWLALFSTLTYAADFQKGVEAFDKGDFKTVYQEWYPLAEQGDAIVQYNLGIMYANGNGVLKDFKEAGKWYRKAAEQGYANAQHKLGIMYANGYSVLKDFKEAEKWFRKAAEQGHAQAQYNLGVIYQYGEGVLKNTVIAESWFLLAEYNGYSNKIIHPKNVDENQAQALAKQCLNSGYKNCG